MYVILFSSFRTNSTHFGNYLSILESTNAPRLIMVLGFRLYIPNGKNLGGVFSLVLNKVRSNLTFNQS